jgi:branched-chain amino acid transport system substrate-binding protein
MKSKMRKPEFAVVMMVFGLLLTVMAVYGTSPVEGAEKAIKVGLVYDVSGPYAPISKINYDILLPYIKYLNKEGGIAGHPVDLVFYDSASNPATATSSVKKLTEQDKVHMIFGNTMTGNAIPMGLAAAEGQTVYAAHTGSIVAEQQWRKAKPHVYPWTFRVNISGEPDMNLPTCAVLKEMNIKKIAILHPESAYGKAQSTYLRKIAPSYDLEVVASESYPVDATVFGAQIASLRRHSDIGAVFGCGAELASALALAAVREAGMKVITISSVPNASPEMMAVQKVSKAFAIQPGHIIQSWGGEGWQTMPRGPQRDQIEEFNNKFFRPTFGFDVNGYWYISAFANWQVLQKTWEKVLKDKPGILDQDLATIRSTYRDYLENMKNVQTCAGVFTFSPEDHNGYEICSGVILAQWVDGKWIYLPKYQPVVNAIADQARKGQIKKYN